jgi:hypothetical protein
MRGKGFMVARVFFGKVRKLGKTSTLADSRPVKKVTKVC